MDINLNLLAIDVDGPLADYEEAMGLASTSKIIAREDFWQNPPYAFWEGLGNRFDGKIFQQICKGFDIVFLTNCPNTTARKAWLEKHGYWNDRCALWCNPPKTSKRKCLELLKPLAFVDDYSKNIDESKGLGIPLVFFFDTKHPYKSWMRFHEELKRHFDKPVKNPLFQGAKK